jgi:hypothetical protein
LTRKYEIYNTKNENYQKPYDVFWVEDPTPYSKMQEQTAVLKITALYFSFLGICITYSVIPNTRNKIKSLRSDYSSFLPWLVQYILIH